MFELIDPSPEIEVDQAEYQRLLGYPRAHVMEDLSRDRADGARAWYARHGRPWIYARQIQTLETAGPLRMDGLEFDASNLKQSLVQAKADSAVLVAVSAGAEIEREAARAWADGRPDDYFFLEIFGSAVVEHLITQAGARICAWADGKQLAALPHAGPGYNQWDVREQTKLLDLIRGAEVPIEFPGPIEALDSGMLVPKKSLLAVFGLSHHLDLVDRSDHLVPCRNCSFSPCRYRRAPYRRSPLPCEVPPPPAAPLTANARYHTNIKALARWSSQRLSLKDRADGSIQAVFRYEGTTCGNRALRFDYEVLLGPPTDGYPIRAQRCAPAAEDEGHTFMCSYIEDPQSIMTAIATEKPLLGRNLDEVLEWRRPLNSAGCYCEAESRAHKWGLVLETLHYALSKRSGG